MLVLSMKYRRLDKVPDDTTAARAGGGFKER